METLPTPLTGVLDIVVAVVVVLVELSMGSDGVILSPPKRPDASSRSLIFFLSALFSQGGRTDLISHPLYRTPTRIYLRNLNPTCRLQG